MGTFRWLFQIIQILYFIYQGFPKQSITAVNFKCLTEADENEESLYEMLE